MERSFTDSRTITVNNVKNTLKTGLSTLVDLGDGKIVEDVEVCTHLDKELFGSITDSKNKSSNPTPYDMDLKWFSLQKISTHLC